MFLLKSFIQLKYTCFSILHSRSHKYKSLLYFVMQHWDTKYDLVILHLKNYNFLYRLLKFHMESHMQNTWCTDFMEKSLISALVEKIYTFEDLSLKQQIYDNFRM